MGILESISAMGIGKLIVLGIFFSFALILLVGMVLGLVLGSLALSEDLMSALRRIGSPRQPSRKRTISLGIMLIAVGMGIIVSFFNRILLPGTIGITMLFGGLGLIISYFVTSAIEKRHRGEKE